MPGFAHLVLSAPLGFIAGCKRLNEVIVTNAHAKDSIVKACSVSYGEDRSVSQTTLEFQEEVKILGFIINCFERASPKPTVPEMVSVLDNSTFLSREAIALIISGIDSVMSSKTSEKDAATSSAISEHRKTVNFGRLSNLQWRLGVALSSSFCQNLCAPYVALSFDIVDTNGSKTLHTTEMTYVDFMKFQAEFQKVNSVMSAM